MEDFSWDGLEVTECSSTWTDSTLVHRSSIFSPALYNGIDPIPRQIELQRAQTSLIENFNSARWARGDSHVHCSGLISPMSLSVNPVSSGCMNLQSAVTPVVAGQANDGLNIIESSSKDSLNMLDCLLSATNSSNGFVGEDGAMSSPPILQNTHSRCCWKYGTSQTVSSGDSENDNASLPDSKAKVNEGINKRKSNAREGGLRLISEVDPTRSKRVRSGKNRGQNHNLKPSASSNICFQLHPGSSSPTSCIDQEPDHEAIAQMKEMIYRAAAFRPVNLGAEMVEKPKRKNVRISSDPLTMAARQRRERISERIRVLQRLVPGGTKMDTASMLEEAANYLKFLQSQIKALENLDPKLDGSSTSCYPINNLLFSSVSFNNTLNPMQAHPFPLQNPYQSAHSQS